MSEVKEQEADARAASGDRLVTRKWFIAALVVAVLGALLWYLVAIKLGYEFGAIAWLIGGAVGYAALSTGARADATGVICGLLVLVSICGGKYLSVASQQAEFAEWRQYSLGGTIEEISTLDLMVDSLGWIDILFLFFGIGTAYRLASHGGGS